jgi:predicted acetyltransferase
VDDGGVVRATAAAASWGRTAGVFFVNTDPAWRGRGVGTVMTAAALRSASDAGAQRAYLDASALGLSIYQRLGFASVGAVTQYVDQR